MDISNLSIKEAVFKIKKKEISAVEVVKNALQKIKKYDFAIKAFLEVEEKEALKKAQEVDKVVIKEDIKLPLAGAVLAVKDIYSTKDIKTTAASKIIEDYIPSYSATVINKLEEAGAIIIGKTNCDAFAHGGTGENSDFGTTCNPWNSDYVAGGSSSGSGAATSYGGCLGAMGTDTGGSIRVPSACCNLIGLKPTYGRVSRFGVIAMSSSLDSMGHITKTIEDSALILSVTAGYDSLDATSSQKEVDNYTDTFKSNCIQDIKIGLPKELFEKGVNEDIKKLVLSAAKKLSEMGAKIESVSLPSIKYTVPVYYLVMSSEVSSNLARFDGIRFGKKRAYFGEEAKRRIMLGTFALSAGYYDAYYLKANKVRTLMMQDFEKTFLKFDCLLAPTMPFLPRKIGEHSRQELKVYLEDYMTASINLAGLPSLSIPCGFIDELPIGMQIIGPQFSEKLLFQVGDAYQKLTDWHKRKPDLSKIKDS